MKIQTPVAIVIVDPQNGFLHGGELGCSKENSELVLAGINTVLNDTTRSNSDVQLFITVDNHPEDHCSFLEQNGPFPKHCVVGTHSAQIHESINTANCTIIPKGLDKNKEEFCIAIPGLEDVKTIYILGLVLDICVMETAKLLRTMYPNAQIIIMQNVTCALDVNITTKEDKIKYIEDNGFVAGTISPLADGIANL